MQKRLTTRDVILYVLLTLIVLLLILLMYQVDRQWNKLSEMQSAVTEQAKDLHDVRNTVGKLQQSWNEGLLVRQVAASTASDGQAGVLPVTGGTIPEAFQRAYQSSQQANYAEGDWKVDTFSTTLKTITPYVSSDVYASDVQSYVLESLLTRNPETLEWTGLIAKSWTVSDDGLVINFQLRPNVTFSDGEPLTAEDVAFTYDFMMNEGINAPGERAYYEKLKSVTAKSPLEVEFVFKDPYFEALGAAGGIPILAKHFYEEYMTKTEAFNNSKGLLLGSGPYRLADPKSWSSEQGNVELLRNPRYWGAVQPSLDKMVWRIIQNDSARLTTYRNGDIDVYSARPIEYDVLRQDEQITGKSHNFEYMSPTAGYSYIGWNQQSGENATRFADKRVRQAMTYLTDRDTIIRDIYRGYAEAAISPFSPRSKQHDPALLPRKADVDKAKALLKEAGYEDRNNDGLLEDAAGEPFSFKLMYSQGSDDTKSLVLLLKDMYAKAGVQLLPEPTEWSVMLERLDTKNFDATILGWSSGFETDIYQMFHSSQAKTGGNNFISYRSKELDALIDEARVIVDEAKRMPVWQKAEAVFYEDQPYTFLLRRQSLKFIDKRMENVSLTPSGLNLDFQPIEVFVPKAAQKYQ